MNNQKGKVIASISNTGVSQINFLTIEIEDSDDYNLLSAEKIYLGNLDSDDFETADFEIYMDSDKSVVPVNLRLHYEDEYNNEYDTQETINIRLYSQEEALKFGLTQQKSYTGTIVFVLVILLLVGYFIRRRMKRRK
jgi:hypothetical protein